jgi:beta-fructofuranosidase
MILAGMAGLMGLGLPDTAAIASGRASTAVPAGLRPRFSAGAYRQIYDPSAGESVPWYINDHTMVRGADGTWHLFGITAPSGSDYTKERQFAHATAPSLHGPWTKHPPALVFDPAYFGENRLWAPHVIRVGDLYHMFYTGGGDDWHRIAISLATSPDLWTWTRRPAGPLFRDGYSGRDPYVMKVGLSWVMYYTATSDGTIDGRFVIAYRTSPDLVNWSGRAIAYADPQGGPISSNTESPFVVEHHGRYYLFIGPRGDYRKTEVFVSDDPLHFEPAGLTGSFASHAAEVVTDVDGSWWVTSCGWFDRVVSLAPLLVTDPLPHTWTMQDHQHRAVAVARTGVGGLVVARYDAAGWLTSAPSLTTDHDGVVTVVPAGRLAAALDVYRKTTLFARTSTGRVFHAWKAGPDSTQWHSALLPDRTDQGTPTTVTIAGDPAAAQDLSGRMNVFARTADNRILHSWQHTPGLGPWHSVLIDGRIDTDGSGTVVLAGDPAAVLDPNGKLCLFMRTADGRIFHAWQHAPGVGPWHATVLSVGGITGRPAVVQEGDGRLTYFATTAAGGLVTGWQTSPGLGPWQTAVLPTAGAVPAGDPAAVLTPTGRLEVAVRTTTGALLHASQQAPATGTYTSVVVTPGSPLAGDPAFITGDGAGSGHRLAFLEVLARTTSDQLAHLVRDPRTRTWRTTLFGADISS